jgi:hypothetical protein
LTVSSSVSDCPSPSHWHIECVCVIERIAVQLDCVIECVGLLSVDDTLNLGVSW